MNGTIERMGLYGLANGLGFHGSPEEKARLLRGLRRAISSGDWDRVLGIIAAYGAGASVGSWVRQKTGPNVNSSATGVQWW